MSEVIFIISLIAGLILPFLFLTGKGRIFWLVTMGTIGCVVGGGELASKLMSGKTISQHFWIWSQLHPTTGWIVLGCLAIGWGSLLLHLARRLIKPKP